MGKREQNKTKNKQKNKNKRKIKEDGFHLSPLLFSTPPVPAYSIFVLSFQFSDGQTAKNG